MKFFIPIAIMFIVLLYLASYDVINFEKIWIFKIGMYFFGAIAFANFYPLVIEENNLKLSEIGLESIKEGLSEKTDENIEGTKNILLNFPTTIEAFNGFLEKSELLGSPIISEDYSYDCYRALITTTSKEDGGMDVSTKEGLKKMIDAVKYPKGPIMFYDFIRGLNLIVYGKKTHNNYFESIEPSFGVLHELRKHAGKIMVAVITALIVGILSFVFGIIRSVII